jgi:hypothetical protein
MERRALTCPMTAHLEVIDYERTSLGILVEGCTRFSPGDVRCNRECSRRLDRRDRADNDDPTERVLVVYARERGPAEAIAYALRLDDFTVELADACVAGAPPPEDYDAVVIVSQPNWLNFTHAIDAYVGEHAAGLLDRPSHTFDVPRRWSRRSIDTLATAFARAFGDAIPSSIVGRP